MPAGAGDVALPSAATGPEPALVLPNDGDASYCKIRLDPGSLTTVTASLGRIADPLNRAVAWNGVRDLARRGDADLARVLCQHGFPHHAVDAATLRAGQEVPRSGTGYGRPCGATPRRPRRRPVVDAAA